MKNHNDMITIADSTYQSLKEKYSIMYFLKNNNSSSNPPVERNITFALLETVAKEFHCCGEVQFAQNERLDFLALEKGNYETLILGEMKSADVGNFIPLSKDYDRLSAMTFADLDKNMDNSVPLRQVKKIYTIQGFLNSSTSVKNFQSMSRKQPPNTGDVALIECWNKVYKDAIYSDLNPVYYFSAEIPMHFGIVINELSTSSFFTKG
ncbi:MAG: hypothetical protein LLG02_01535 [Pelosinus sp.]|nr:hypothetical protein [Pelosinus sp.]